MLSRKIIGLLGLVSLGISNAQVHQCSIAGQCIQSDVIFELHKESERECLRECKSTSGCQWYTYNMDKTNCLLLKNCHVSDAKVATIFYLFLMSFLFQDISTEECTSCVSGEA